MSGREAARTVAVRKLGQSGEIGGRPPRSGRRGQNIGTGLYDDLVPLVDQFDLGIDADRLAEGVAHLDGEPVDGGDGGGVELDGGGA